MPKKPSFFFYFALVSLLRGSFATTRALRADDDATDSTVSLYFSLWFPNGETWSIDVLEQAIIAAGASSSSSLSTTREAALAQGILESVQWVLCHNPNIMVTNVQRDNNEDLVNVCINTTGKSARLQQASGQSITYETSVLLQEPETVVVRKRAVDEFQWFIWTIQYQVLGIGSHFVQETLENQGNLDSEAELTTMQHALQLDLDVSIVKGIFDEILAQNIPQVKVYSSTIREERVTFGSIEDGLLGPRVVYTPRTWYPMRITGCALLLATIFAYTTLFYLAKRRRKQLERERNEAENAPNRDGSVKLVSPTAVDTMLSRTSLLSLPPRNEEIKGESLEEYFQEEESFTSHRLHADMSIKRITSKQQVAP